MGFLTDLWRSISDRFEVRRARFGKGSELPKSSSGPLPVDWRDASIDVDRQLPPEIIAPDDAAPAARMLARLAPFGGATSPLRAVLPDDFASYARVLHPAGFEGPDGPVRWADVAKWSGKAMHPEVQWEAIESGGDPRSRPWSSRPSDGRVPPNTAIAVADALRRFTTTPDDLWICIWEGFGGTEEILAPFPRVSRPWRSYYVCRATWDAFRILLSDPRLSDYVHPSMWWPADEAFCVATEVDFCWTCVGGSNAAITALKRVPELEVLDAKPDHRGDILSDTLNDLP